LIAKYKAQYKELKGKEKVISEENEIISKKTVSVNVITPKYFEYIHLECNDNERV
jgi:hypothetical protein